MVFAAGGLLAMTSPTLAAEDGAKPNIVVIMGDDIGMWNIGAYHRGLMAGRTPNLDKIAAEGMIFTDYYAEASCTAGRANFITGELADPHGYDDGGASRRTHRHSGAGSDHRGGVKSMGYATGQFGKNHLGDRNEFLPTVHGFDEFYGYLYHLDAMEDPCHPNYPQNLRNQVGPRNMLHTVGDDQRRCDCGPSLGQGRQAEDRRCGRNVSHAHGNGGRRNSATRRLLLSTRRRPTASRSSLWLNPTRMHIVTHLSPKYQATAQLGERLVDHEAGMAQLDDDIGW
jgi:arylsulfatase